MGRPLTGTKRQNKDGSVTIELPSVKGGRRDLSQRFSQPEEGERWRLAAVAALNAGKPVPSPDQFRYVAPSTLESVLRDDFASVAWAWFNQHYIDFPKCGPKRVLYVESQLRNIVIPFFAARVNSVKEVTLQHGLDFVAHLAGRRATPAARTTALLTEARYLTKAEAVAWSGASKSRIGRAWLSGAFPGAYLDQSTGQMGKVQIPIGDLLDAGFRPKEEDEAETSYGYAESTATGLLWIAREVIDHAIAHDIRANNPLAKVRSSKPDKGVKRFVQPPTRRVVAFDLERSQRIARHLPIHQQVAFWICRCMGTRISEAHGIHLDDISIDEGHMMIDFHRQGGQWFEVEGDKRREFIKVPETDRMKTDSAPRIIPVPQPLAELISLYIEAFHADGAPSSPLIIASPGTGNYRLRRAINIALERENLTQKDIGYSAAPHFYRKCFVTDVRKASQRHRSAYVGHRLTNHDGGAAITEAVYTLDTGNVRDLLPVAEEMAHVIENSIGALLTPAPASQLLSLPGYTSKKRSDAEMRVLEHARAIFDAAGYLSELSVDGQEVLSTTEAAELLGLNGKYVAWLARKGLLEGVNFPRVGRGKRLGITVASIEAYRREREVTGTFDDCWTRKEIAAELGITYADLHVLIKRLELTPEVKKGSRPHFYADAEVDKLRAHIARNAAAIERSVTISEAAKQLRLHPETVRREMHAGRLDVDEEASETYGVTMVTRDSVDRLKSVRSAKARRTRQVELPPNTIPILEAQALTGLKRMEILALTRQGVVMFRGPDYNFYVDRPSLEAWMQRRCGDGF